MPRLVEPPLEVELRRRQGEPETRVALLGTDLGTGREAFQRLDARLILIARKLEQPTGRIDAGAWVPHRDVVRCLDSFLLAGADEVAFVGRPPPRGVR
ncbi:MAG: hypothetical protein ABFS86_09850 [Planctomycetota bacterium]